VKNTLGPLTFVKQLGLTLGETVKKTLSKPTIWKTETFMGLPGWHPGFLIFVAGYMCKRESGFILTFRFLIPKAKHRAASGIEWLLKHRRRHIEEPEKLTLVY